ncbi:Bromodomain transcription factor [Forsythia ovata]|uniref:Bromodomain transcription factor n=1 Tax=Forsythia ovata TaxID=205694 RepID=A0ABD1T9U6_9LAMI
MSDGGKVESKRDEGNPVVRGDAEDFGRAMSRIAVAQLCKRIGFASLNESALDSLTDIAIRYLRNLGKIASCYTNLAGRTVSNAFDIIRGLEDLQYVNRLFGCFGAS